MTTMDGKLKKHGKLGGQKPDAGKQQDRKIQCGWAKEQTAPYGLMTRRKDSSMQPQSPTTARSLLLLRQSQPLWHIRAKSFYRGIQIYAN